MITKESKYESLINNRKKINEKLRMITISGPPSSGKTAVIIKTLESHPELKTKSLVVKFDSLSSLDEDLYIQNGISARTGLSGNICPDHYFVSNIEECYHWAVTNHYEILITESAGLCNRCAPHLKNILSICVLDNLSGINTPLKNWTDVKNC